MYVAFLTDPHYSTKKPLRLIAVFNCLPLINSKFVILFTPPLFLFKSIVAANALFSERLMEISKEVVSDSFINIFNLANMIN
ncbi:hypothetical protein MHYMCMPASI_01147 [Hyalomma marginatum]|uniref:Uncharacterized protein n=1 Tax=Hyalomma marginatum TaxID=34627 RepID=A0A8S4C2T9_9ACAR|nr:hypothetical protein MHYMCMPASI_01147 [Hyalomma marginatum]